MIKTFTAATATMLLAACSQHGGNLHTHQHTTSGIEASHISADALIGTPKTVACELENGASADCLQVVVKYLPDLLEIGPFCPATLNDEGGIWNWTGDNCGASAPRASSASAYHIHR